MITVWRKPYTGIIFTYIIMGFAPVFDRYLGGNSLRFGTLAIMFVIQLLRQKIISKKNSAFIAFIVIVLSKELLGVATNTSLNSFLQAVYSYIVVVGITYFSYWDLKDNNIDFLNLYKIYIILCLGVLFYRTTIDYTFWGMALEDDLFEKNSDLYEYGSYSFRPSSLESAIIFSIELSIFMGWMLFKEGITKNNLLLYIVSLIGLLLTFSRSGFLILLIVLAIYTLRNHITLKKVVLIIVGLVVLMQAFDYTERFLDIFKMSGETAGYQGRFNSMGKVWSQIKSFDFVDLLLGKGYGIANTPGEDGAILYYVENYYFTLMINSGLLALFFFIAYYLHVIINGVKHFNFYTLLCCLILMVNFIACSLYANTVFILLFYLSLCVLYGDTYISEKIYVCNKKQYH